jgi:hypothetical protein
MWYKVDGYRLEAGRERISSSVSEEVETASEIDSRSQYGVR